jgi:hypothetical protein
MELKGTICMQAGLIWLLSRWGPSKQTTREWRGNKHQPRCQGRTADASDASKRNRIIIPELVVAAK